MGSIFDIYQDVQKLVRKKGFKYWDDHRYLKRHVITNEILTDDEQEMVRKYMSVLSDRMLVVFEVKE